MTATSALGRSVVMSIERLSRGGPPELADRDLVAACRQDTVRELVRQVSGEVDAHPAQAALIERQVERRLGHGGRVERRSVVADPEAERLRRGHGRPW